MSRKLGDHDSSPFPVIISERQKSSGYKLKSQTEPYLHSVDTIIYRRLIPFVVV